MRRPRVLEGSRQGRTRRHGRRRSNLAHEFRFSPLSLSISNVYSLFIFSIDLVFLSKHSQSDVWDTSWLRRRDRSRSYLPSTSHTSPCPRTRPNSKRKGFRTRSRSCRPSKARGDQSRSRTGPCWNRLGSAGEGGGSSSSETLMMRLRSCP